MKRLQISAGKLAEDVQLTLVGAWDSHTAMSSELTEMAGVGEAETQAAYAWALDYDDFDESPTVPTQRLTPRRIISLALASSLTVIAVAGAVALGLAPAHEPSRPVVATPAAVLDGTYRFDYNLNEQTINGSPNSPPEGQPKSQTHWGAFRSTCTPAGCVATSTSLDDKTHTVVDTPPTARQWRFVNGRSNRQYLWIKIFYAASSVAVVSSGRSTSLPFSNFAPARTSATRWGALTARQRGWAASISL